MNEIKQAVVSVVNYPVEKYSRLRDYRHRRIQDEPITWNIGLWTRLHPSLRSGYKWCLTLVGSVWLLCLVFTIWTVANHESGDGLVFTLQTGSRSAVRRSNLWVHLLINTVASSVYAVSSYVMQKLAAPTRADIDNAHREGASVKVGSLAVTNFALLSKKKFAVFALLWSSSLPIHLMFNSVIIYTSTNAEWSNYAITLSEDQLETLRANTSYAIPLRDYSGFSLGNSNLTTWSGSLAQHLLQQEPPFVELPLTDCVKTYSTGSNPTYRDVVLLSETQHEYLDYASNLKSPSSYVPPTTFGDDPWSWMCKDYDDSCDGDDILRDGRWTIDDYVISRCLARRLPDLCELNANMAIMVVVLVCITSKFICMVMAIMLSRRQPLITIGDAISSFLHEPEALPQIGATPGAQPSTYRRVTRRRPSRRRTVLLEMPRAYAGPVIFGLVGLGIALYFFVFTWQETRKAYHDSSTKLDFKQMFELGFGNLPALWTDEQSEYIMAYSSANSPSTSYIDAAVLANLPQLALSGIYLVFNNSFTRLFTALEFRSFAVRRRGLRVSTPDLASRQRRAHFLQISLRWSLLNVVVFVALHTLLFQTLFLRRAWALYPTSDTSADPEFIGKHMVSMIGFSPLASLFLVKFLAALVFTVIGLGFWNVDWVFPNTTGQSCKISAVCHRPKDSVDTQDGEVRYGVIGTDVDGTASCSFSLLPVRPLDKVEKMICYKLITYKR